MRKALIAVVIMMGLCLAPVLAIGAQIEGTVQGFTCVTQGKVCPVGAEDPMAAVENVFVVLTATQKYYFVPNVDRAVLARHINDKVRVVGNLTGNAITAKALYEWRNNMWMRVYTPTWKNEIMDDLFGPGAGVGTR
ncbi:MAG: hypothetical protein JRI34_06575 [Deltaproteobacteria bacterium]|nr:hypothetical protein [Deltaproteobacteria bacterium]